MIIFPLLVGLAGALQAQFEEPMRQHDAHVHGQASGNLALDASTLRLELDIPAYNLIGFEHAPVTADQQALLDATLAVLEQMAWLNLDARGQCQARSIDVQTHGMTNGSSDDHNHGHDQDHATDNHGHGVFRLVAEFDCLVVSDLGWLMVDLFSDYPANESLPLDVLTEQGADRVELGPGRMRVTLNGR